MTINIYEFSRRFSKEYNFLYDNYGNVAGYNEAVQAFDEFIQNERNAAFVGEFCKYRQDIITSDREAAAFMFALDTF